LINDNGIQRHEYHAYEPQPGTNLNTTGEIRMHVTSKDTIVHPAGSYLLVEGRLKKTDGTVYVADKVTFVNNGIMYPIRLNQTSVIGEDDRKRLIIQVRKLLVLGLLKYPRGFAKAQGFESTVVQGYSR
jgi:hypothetical protein